MLITHYFESIDSTSGFLKDYLLNHGEGDIHLCYANKQTAGYGQHGHQWSSPDKACLFSFAIPVESQILPTSMSYILAVILHQYLSRANASLTLKWPNDLFNHQGKVAGILLEMVKSKSSQWYLVVGIGINLSLPKQMPLAYSFGFVTLDRPLELMHDVMSEFIHFLQTDLRENPYYELWKANDYFNLDEEVLLLDDDKIEKGLYKGLSIKGEIKIQCGTLLRSFYSGQVKLRKNE